MDERGTRCVVLVRPAEMSALSRNYSVERRGRSVERRDLIRQRLPTIQQSFDEHTALFAIDPRHSTLVCIVPALSVDQWINRSRLPEAEKRGEKSPAPTTTRG
jgi:hypothetical protein